VPGTVSTIVIDPGHGGEEEGAKGPTGLLEKQVVLDLSQRLRQRLQSQGFTVYLTRDSDESLALDERTAIANNKRADLFISIHANASPTAEARGAETWFLSLSRMQDVASTLAVSPGDDLVPSAGDRDDPLKLILWDMAQASSIAESSVFAETVQAELNHALDLKDRGVKQAPFRVLVGATMPAVLVEIGFISNPDEEARLRDPQFLDTLADAISRAVGSYRDTLRLQGNGAELGWKPGGQP
jgi:N-acetylmuramoyl-L-alanine amidase